MAFKRRSKYGAKRVKCDGITFDSEKEARRYIELKRLEAAGEITDLELQVRYELIPDQHEPSSELYVKGPKKGTPKPGRLIEKGCAYFADFVYVDADGVEHVEDTKGYKTQEYIIKRKLMLFLKGIRIEEV